MKEILYGVEDPDGELIDMPPAFSPEVALQRAAERGIYALSGSPQREWYDSCRRAVGAGQVIPAGVAKEIGQLRGFHAVRVKVVQL